MSWKTTSLLAIVATALLALVGSGGGRHRPAGAAGGVALPVEAAREGVGQEFSRRAGVPGVRAIAPARGREDTAALATALIDPDAGVRITAIEAIGDGGSPTTLPLLERALVDVDVTVREAAVAALGDVGGCAVLPYLARALEDEHASVRLDAVYAIAEFSGERPFALLQSMLADPQRDVRASAAELLQDTAVAWPPRCD